MSRLYSVLVFAVVLSFCETVKILGVFQSPFPSHNIAFRHIVNELLKNGHQIDVITTDPAYPKGETPQNLTEIDIHEATYQIWKKHFVENKKGKLSTQISNGLNLMVDIFVSQLNCDEMKPFVKHVNKSYDIVLAEAAFPPCIIFSHIYKVPFVLMSSMGVLPATYEFMGVPRNILFYPETLRNRGYNISVFESYGQIYEDLSTAHQAAAKEDIVHEILVENYIQDLPKYDKLYDNVNMLLANIHPVWEGIRPYPPNHITVHNFAPRQKQVIPKDYQSYLDSSKNGVIYFSFGTTIPFSTLPQHIAKAILGVFSRLPYDILMKSDKDEILGLPNNVKLFKWLPQPDVLGHPKIKLFITQGGQHSIDEAVEAGVPLIVIPSIFDQFVNSERCVHHGIGRRFDMKAITEENLLDAITDVVENKMYRENAQKLNSFLNDNPIKSIDRLIWAIEYVIRHKGAKHMRSPSANLSWAEFFELELLLYCLSFTVFVLFIIFKLLLAAKKLVLKLIVVRK